MPCGLDNQRPATLVLSSRVPSGQIIQRDIARLTAPIETNSQTPQKPRILSHRFKMSVQLPPATHRKRALPQGELEAASTLKLGADQNTHTLSLSEARLVINKVLENKRRGGKKYEEPE